MSYPDSYSATLADAAMGPTRDTARQSDAAEARAALAKMWALVDELRAIGSLPWGVTDEIEVALAKVGRVL